MKRFYSRVFALFAMSFSFMLHAQSQQKLVVIGSSTSYGSGTTAYDSTYVARLQKYYNDNGMGVTIKNLAAPGTDCYSGMPSNYTPPPDRVFPDQARNITAALAENPNVVLVNFPTNGYVSFSITEIMFCFRTIKKTANDAGKLCYITTTQPRTEYNAAARVKLRILRDSILNEFGQFAINFYDGLAEPVSDTIAGPYRAGDGIHLNNAGHAVLAQRVEQKNIFNPVVVPPVPPPLPPAGPLKFKYFTFSGTWYNLPDLNALTPVTSATMSNVNIVYRTQNDQFAYLWQGYINIPVSGLYTFRTTSDDGSQLFIGNSSTPLINNDGLHGPQDRDGAINLNAGTYPIEIRYYEQGGGETMAVSWKTPQAANNFVPIPNSAFVETPSIPPAGGLRYRYYTFTGTWYNMPSLHALTPVATGTMPNITLANRTQNDRFAYLWEGNIYIPVSGSYTFRTTSDDGSQFWIGSLPGPLINNDGLHGPQDLDGTITLNAGTYPIAVLYYEQEGGESMTLSWKTPQAGSFVPVPSSAFTPAPVASGPIRYRYYTFTGTWYNMPSLHALTPAASGTVSNITLANRTQDDRFAYLWEGNLHIPVSGNYTFRTTSDDGSQFWIGSLPGPLINNDGLHPAQDLDGTISLNAGDYPIAVLYFEQDGGETMVLSWKTPQTGTSFVPIPDAAFVNAPALAAFSENIAAYNTKMASANTRLSGADALSIFPNPSSEQVTVRFNDAENSRLQVRLIDAGGVVLSTNTYQKQSTHWQQQVRVAHLKPGYYTIQVTGKKINYRLPFIKK